MTLVGQEVSVVVINVGVYRRVVRRHELRD